MASGSNSSLADTSVTAEDAKKLQEGISVLSTILSRVTSSPAQLGQINEANPEPPCSTALSVLRSVRQRITPGGKVEHKRNFAPYSIKNACTKKGINRKRTSSCSFKMNCLSSPCDVNVPSSASQKELLLEAGLGLKDVYIPDVLCSREEFNDAIISTYPKLKSCGGFELLRCVPNSKQLEEISESVAQSPKLLKTVIANGRVYIRPVQKNLDLDPPDESTSTSVGLKEKCLNCGEEMLLSGLRKHAQKCRRENEYNSDDDFEGSSKGKCKVVDRSPIVVSSSEDELISGLGRNNDFLKKHETDVNETESMLFEYALRESTDAGILEPNEGNGNPNPNEERSSTPPTFPNILTKISSNLSTNVTCISVRRGHVLVDALRAMKCSLFSVKNQVTVDFLDEQGADGGGPSREFWCLLAKGISKLCEGKPTQLTFRHDSVALQETKFHQVGCLMAMAIANGSSGFPFLSKATYNYLCDIPLEDITIEEDEVPNYEVRTLLEKIRAADSVDDLSQICMNEVFTGLILEAGYTKPISRMSLHDKLTLERTLKMHFGLLRCKAELDQLKSGLSALGVGEAMRSYPDVMAGLFVSSKTVPLTTDSLKKLFEKILFSPTGTSEREKEESTYMMFLDLLYACEDCNGDSITLGDILAFFTGAETIPPLGFEGIPWLRFNPTNVFPTASTCSLELTLPTMYYNNPEEFCKKMQYGIQNHGGFGLE